MGWDGMGQNRELITYGIENCEMRDRARRTSAKKKKRKKKKGIQSVFSSVTR
jgi:hypothetical protein